MPQVSVLVAVYNASRYLSQCLDSLLSQTLRDIEVICIDDASTDNSYEILSSYASRDNRIRLLRNETNIGQALSRNRGIEIAQGQYTCFLDSDDWFDTDTLSRAVSVIDSDPSTDCVLFRLLLHHSDGSESEAPLACNFPIDGQTACHLSIDWRIHGVYLARTELFRRYPYDTTCRYFSDDNSTRIHYLHSRRVALCEGIYHYRRHDQSGTMKVSLISFDHITANISLKRQLEAENVPQSMLDTLERMRLFNLIGAYKTYFFHKHQFNANETQIIKQKIKTSLLSIESHRLPLSLRLRFGYSPIHCYGLFALQEELFWSLRRITGKE